MLGRAGPTAVVALAAIAIGAAAALTWIRATYGVWWPGFLPERIPLCSMPYDKFDDQVLTYTVAVSQEPSPAPIVVKPTVGQLPLGAPTPPRFLPGASYNGCGHMLLLQVSSDGYVRYFQLGGP